MTRIGEKHGALTIIAQSSKRAHGYLYYYWVRCECGYIKRLRYDQIRKGVKCGLCEDFSSSGVLERAKDGKKEK